MSNIAHIPEMAREELLLSHKQNMITISSEVAQAMYQASLELINSNGKK